MPTLVMSANIEFTTDVAAARAIEVRKSAYYAEERGHDGRWKDDDRTEPSERGGGESPVTRWKRERVRRTDGRTVLGGRSDPSARRSSPPGAEARALVEL